MSIATVMGTPSLGSLFGTVGSDNLIKQINQDLGQSCYFGSVDDILSKGRQMFVDNIIIPIRSIGNSIKDVIGIVEEENGYIPITDMDRLRAVPQLMHMPILLHPPVAKLFNDGRIFGWGYEHIPTEDYFGRLINNGSVEDVLSAMDDQGEFELTWEFRCTDPELEFEDMEAIIETRNYIDSIMELGIDFTDPLVDENGKFPRRG